MFKVIIVQLTVIINQTNLNPMLCWFFESCSGELAGLLFMIEICLRSQTDGIFCHVSSKMSLLDRQQLGTSEDFIEIAYVIIIFFFVSAVFQDATGKERPVVNDGF